MVKKMMVGLLIAMVGVCFGAKFNYNEAYKLFRQKDYVKLQEYLTTNNECNTNSLKMTYNEFSLWVRMTVKKDVNKSNILSIVNQEFKEGKINGYMAVNILYMSRFHIPELNQNLEFARLTKQFYEENKTQKSNKYYFTFVLFSYGGLKEFDNLLNLLNVLEEKQIEERICKITNERYLKSFTTEQKITYFGMVSKNPAKFIRTANDLTSVVEQASKIMDTKYDTVMKELYTKLNRAFYGKIVESDAWKQALVKLQLTMKPYNL